jgi:hypothetical protein
MIQDLSGWNPLWEHGCFWLTKDQFTRLKPHLPSDADSDDRGHQFQSDRGHHSDLMAAT